MSTLVVGYGALTKAQDPAQVCGNGAKEGMEQCDDGNLSNGDDCSSQCTIEKCGNGIVDYAKGEQCDGTAGCDIHCHIEYCGDARIQRSEQCDDGNGVSGDGCSSVCALESDVSTSTDETQHPSASAPVQKPLSAPTPRVTVTDITIVREAMKVLDLALFSPLFGSKDELQTILQKMFVGRMSTKERERGLFIIRSLQEHLQKEQKSTQDFVQKLVDVSESYFRELGIDTGKLRHADATVVLQELDRMAPVRTPVEIRATTSDTQSYLADLGVTIPSLGETATAGEMFRSIVTIVDSLRGQKTRNLDDSMRVLRDTEDLKGVLRTFQAEKALPDAVVTQMNDRIDHISTSQTPKDTVSALRLFTKELESVGVLTPSDLSVNAHAGAPESSPDDARVLSPETVTAVIETIPTETATSFKIGTLADQVNAFKQFLRGDEHIRTLRASLAPERSGVYAERFHDIDTALDRIASGQSMGACDTSMSAVLLCTNQLLSELETEVRSSESVFDHAVHYLQDRFYRYP